MDAVDGFNLRPIPNAVTVEVVKLEEARQVEGVAGRVSIWEIQSII